MELLVAAQARDSQGHPQGLKPLSPNALLTRMPEASQWAGAGLLVQEPLLPRLQPLGLLYILQML